MKTLFGPRASRPSLTLLGLVLATLARAEALTYDSDTFEGLRPRAIGPAAMSGRIAALDAIEADRLIIYVGVGGRRRVEVARRRHHLQAGVRQALPVDRRRRRSLRASRTPCGSERASRGRATACRSATASTRPPTAATTWTAHGPRATRSASRGSPSIRGIPTPSTSPRPGTSGTRTRTRGVYRTRDGGKTWAEGAVRERGHRLRRRRRRSERIRDIVYAAMWQFRRKPWSFSSGGPGSGLYKSTDGGTTWKKLIARPAGRRPRAHRRRRFAREGRDACTRSVEAKRTAHVPLGRLAARRGARCNVGGRGGAAVLLLLRRRRPEGSRTASTSRASAWA